MSLTLLALSKRDDTYGSHSGYYEQAFRFSATDKIDVMRITPSLGLGVRLIGKAFSLAIGAPRRDQSLAASELHFMLAHRLRPKALCHIANSEDHLPLLSFVRKQDRWLATVHFPADQWRASSIEALRSLSHVVTLCERDRSYLSARLGSDKVTTILHGVDSDFFHPAVDRRSSVPRLLFVGKWLRDFECAGNIFAAALGRWPALEVDLVVARRWTEGTSLAELVEHPRVHWHEGVSDTELRRLYQCAWMLVLPLRDTSANNAIVEALACGTVPVVRAIGGIPDYGGGSIFPTCANATPAAAIEMIARWIESPWQLQATAEACRNFAVTRLDWRLIRAQQATLYRTLVDRSPALLC